MSKENSIDQLKFFLKEMFQFNVKDNTKAIKEIVEKYPETTQIEVNYDFNILATLKDKQLEVGKRLLGLTVIHADIYNQ